MSTDAVRRLTNTEVAQRLGVHHSYVSRLRSGDRVASIPTLIAISDLYDVPVGKLARAASRANKGDTREWVELLDGILVAPTDEPVAAPA